MENSNFEDINWEGVTSLTSTEEIWKTIENLYLSEPDPNKIMEKTGIPASLIKDTVQDQLAKRLKGGEEIWNIATLEDPKITKKQAIDIIYACRGDDGLSVDTKKAKKFLSYFKAQDNTLRGELLKATRRNPGLSIQSWIENAEKSFQERKSSGKKSLGALQAEIRENIPDPEERIEFLTDLIDETEPR
tara:strand:+ start:300 stop:866 length:567 start_codon:yes stop_codon:yes gene_type:complete